MSVVHFFHFVAHVLKQKAVFLGENGQTTLLLVFVLHAGIQNSIFLELYPRKHFEIGTGIWNDVEGWDLDKDADNCGLDILVGRSIVWLVG